MQWSRKRCMQVVSMAAVVSQSSWTTVASQAPELQPAPAWILQAFAGPSTPETVGDRPRALQEIRSSEASARTTRSGWHSYSARSGQRGVPCVLAGGRTGV